MNEGKSLTNIFFTEAFSSAYFKPSQTSKMKFFLEIAKSYILRVFAGFRVPLSFLLTQFV